MTDNSAERGDRWKGGREGNTAKGKKQIKWVEATEKVQETEKKK